MNIALFTDSYLPSKTGVVTVVNQLYENLKLQGHHVVIVTVDNPNLEEKDEDPNIYRVHSSKIGLGMKDQYLGFPFLNKVSRFLKKNKIELIHCHTEFSLGLHAIHEAKKCKLPLVCTTHTMWEDYYRFYVPGGDYISPEFIRYLIRNFYSHANALINVSKKAHDYFKRDNICPEIPSAIIPNAINSDNYCAEKTPADEVKKLRYQYGIQDDEKVLLFVGRIVEEKRVFELVDVLESVLINEPKTKALIVGDGAAYKQMCKMVNKTTVSDRFIFTGFVEWQNVHKYYEAGDVFVTSSLSEMHSMTILEALTSGLPIVVRKDASFYDTVVDDFNGFQCETDEQMSECISKIINNSEMHNIFAKNSIELSKQFLPETFINKHIAFYKTVIDAFNNKKNITDDLLKSAVKNVDPLNK